MGFSMSDTYERLFNEMQQEAIEKRSAKPWHVAARYNKKTAENGGSTVTRRRVSKIRPFLV